MTDIPADLKRFFWGVDFSKLDYQSCSTFIIERLLEYGDREALRWMFETYKQDDIIKTLKQSSNLSLKSANFWALFFEIDRKDVRCLQKPFREIHRAVWKY